MIVKPIRFGLVGGGAGAFIGGVHRHAARLDGQFELVCGALSRDPERALQSGRDLGLAASRSYASAEAMFAGEKALPADKRMQCVVIATPIDLRRLVKIRKPCTRVRYDLQEIGQPDLRSVLSGLKRRRT